MDHEHSSPGRTAGRVAATALVLLAVATSIVLGTAGWFAVGFATMTDCTNSYSCSPAGCPPCTATGRWINAGGLAQWALAAIGVAVLVRARGRRRPLRLAAAGALLLSLSVLTVVLSTTLAQSSYCRPGAPGYADSYCAGKRTAE